MGERGPSDEGAHPGAVCSRVAGLDERPGVIVHEHLEVREVIGLDLCGNGRDDAALPHAHVDDVAHVLRQRELAERLNHEEDGHARERRQMAAKEPEHAHASTPPFIHD